MGRAGAGAGPGRAGFLLRRYSYPAFKLEASYRLPCRAYYVALDAKHNRLFLAADDRPGRAVTRLGGPLVYKATLHRYDLSELPPAGTDPPAVRPLATRNVPKPFAAMVVALDGSLYVSYRGSGEEFSVNRFDPWLEVRPGDDALLVTARNQRFQVAEGGAKLIYIGRDRWTSGVADWSIDVPNRYDRRGVPTTSYSVAPVRGSISRSRMVAVRRFPCDRTEK